MSLPEFSVRKRVTITMIIGVLLILGFITLRRLGLELLPDISYPIVSVVTTYSGASPEDVEILVTKPIEEAVATVGRVKAIRSQSLEGLSVILVEFEWERNLDFAAQDVRDKIGLIRDFLPEAISEPLIVKFDVSILPILYLAVTGDRPPLELRKLTKEIILERVERVAGVAGVLLLGGEEREVAVLADRAKLEHYGVSLSQIVAALRVSNLSVPGGHIEEEQREYVVKTLGQFGSIQDIETAVVGITKDGLPVHLRDVADVASRTRETRGWVKTQGKESVMLLVYKESGENTVIVANRVENALSDIKPKLPGDITIHPVLNQGQLIEKMTTRTASNALWGGILAFLVLFAFLWDWRPTFAISVAIPISVIATFVAVYSAGYTLNVMTIGGLALGVGMLVDNAIVVIENIHRHLQEKKQRVLAAIVGTQEVSRAITASTVTTIVIFVPLIFAGGITGRIARAIGLTVAFSLIASLFVALTIVPMIASVLFRNDRERRGAKVFRILRSRYEQLLERILIKRGRIVLLVFSLFCASLLLLPLIGAEFIPDVDRDFIMMMIRLPEGTPLTETERIVGQLQDICLSIPEALSVTSTVGITEGSKYDVAFGTAPADVNEAEIFVELKTLNERKRSSAEIVARLRREIPPYRGAEVRFVDVGKLIMLGGVEGGINIKIFGSDLETLRELSAQVLNRMKRVPSLYDFEFTYKQENPELRVLIDEERAARYGLTPAQIGEELRIASQGEVATLLRQRGEEVDVRVSLRKEDVRSSRSLEGMTLVTPVGVTTSILQVADVEKGTGPVMIQREGRARYVGIGANYTGENLWQVSRKLKKALDDVLLPAGYFLEYGGEYERMVELFKTLGFALALAILLVYMVMAAEFESFLHPFIMMLTVPLGVIGALFALFVTGRTISLPSGIGGLILVGIVVNNGIVMIDYVNQLRGHGMDVTEALVKGCGTRLRPVLMTATTTVLGMLPMAVSRSEGAEIRSPIAIIAIGGLITATFLTLFVVPVFYSLLEGLKQSIAQRRKP